MDFSYPRQSSSQRLKGSSILSRSFDFSEFPVLETERLVLRELVPDDVDAVFHIRSHPEVTRYNGGPPYTTRERAARLIEDIRAGYAARSELRWGITLRGDSTVIGMCGYNNWNRQDFRATIGYDLAYEFWGQGIMPEALRAMIDFGFNRMALNRIEADVSAANSGSRRVLLKLGFQQEGLLREQYYENGAFHDLCLFALLKRDYKKSTDTSM